MSEIFLSIVIPAHNEEKRLHLALRGFADELDRERKRFQNRGSVEVVVVSDGSTDDTARVARSLLAEVALPGRVIEISPSRGKGGALMIGLRAAAGRYRFFSDADLAAPADSLWPMIERLDGGSDVVIGTRRDTTSRIERHQERLREFLGHGFTKLTNTALGTSFTDFTCGFKGYTAGAVEAIFSRMKIPGWAFDAEALFIASRLGLRIAEVPVVWADVAGSKVDMKAEVFRCVRDLLRIRMTAARGGYD